MMHLIVSEQSMLKAKDIIKKLDDKYLEIMYNNMLSGVAADLTRETMRRDIISLFNSIDEFKNIKSLNLFISNIKDIFNFYVPENTKIFRVDSLPMYELDMIESYVLNKYQTIYENACISINKQTTDFTLEEKYRFLFNLTLCILTGKRCGNVNCDIDYSKCFQRIIFEESYKQTMLHHLDNMKMRETNVNQIKCEMENKYMTYIFILIAIIFMLLKTY